MTIGTNPAKLFATTDMAINYILSGLALDVFYNEFAVTNIATYLWAANLYQRFACTYEFAIFDITINGR